MEIGRRHMPYARALPFLIYLDAAGNFLHGTQGGVTAHSFREDLERVVKMRGGKINQDEQDEK